MKIAFFASSLVSAYWNGAATYYRGIVRALANRGHDITFYEPDAYDRQQHRDIPDPPWAKVVVYDATEHDVHQMIERARGSDLVIKASGVGVFDELLEHLVLELQGPRTMVAFWDVDAPATLDRIAHDHSDPFLPLVRRYDIVFTYGGGPPVVAAYERFGAQRCVPIYNALDPETHHPVPRDELFAGSLGFLGNRLPDRELRVEEFFLRAATQLPEHTFLLGGAGWHGKPMPSNVKYLGHVYTRDHNAFNCTPLALLNVSRESMASYGYSPATRVFEAAGAGACLITDEWIGIEQFLEPDREILVARDGEAVARHVRELTPARARDIGDRAYTRMLCEHTYAHRAEDVEEALGERIRATRRAWGSAGTTRRPLSFVFLGLSITSSWGNGHATTYRSLVRELATRGHDVLFLERDVPWYADNRDLEQPPYGRTSLYRSIAELRDRFTKTVRDADVVIVGSYVPDGIEVGRWVLDTARGVTAFYDIDTPVTLAALEAGRCEYLTAQLASRYQLYLSFTGGPTLQEIQTTLGSPCPRALYCSVDAELYTPAQVERRWQVAYMGTYSADRQAGVQRLLIDPARRCPLHNFVVAGPQYPDAIEWPLNVERIDHLSPAEHREFYNRATFALNLTRREMITRGYSPSVRLFEAAACGVPIISDVWPGIEELFEPGRDVLLARSCEDVLGYMTLSEAERLAIGARGRARVLASHTASHRASQLEDYVREVM
jgi:spore maturation protein CgeB